MRTGEELSQQSAIVVPMSTQTKIDIALGDIQLLVKSETAAYSEEEATKYLQNDTVNIFVDLNIGEGTGKAWGCDLTYDYVRINASYRS